MYSTHTGLGDAWERLSCELKLAATTARFGAAHDEVWDMLMPDDAYLEYVNFLEVL